MSKPICILCLVLTAIGCRTTGDRLVFREIEGQGEAARKLAARLRITDAEHRVALDSALTIEFTLVNQSDEELYVHNEFQPGWLVMIEILSEDGRFERSDWLTEEEGRQRASGNYARVPPGGFVGSFYTIAPEDPRWELTPGRYQARMIYRNPFDIIAIRPDLTDRDCEQLGERSIVPLVTGIVGSNAVSFRVLPD